MDLFVLHGALGARSQLEPIAQGLEQHFRVHTIDFEGHGREPYRDRPYRVAHFAENVIAAMDHRSIDTASFFGYSMGGYVALYLARLVPSRVRAVATLGTKFHWDPTIAAREAGRLDPVILRAKVPAFAKALEERHVGAGGWEPVLSRTAELLRNLGDSPVLTPPVLQSIQQPVHIIVGDRDTTTTVGECESTVHELGHGRLTVLPDTPHPIEQVDMERLLPLLKESFGRA